MTVEELRQLVAEATPGLWAMNSDTPHGPFWREVQNEADARLIALAPTLAELVAEMGEALGDLVRASAAHAVDAEIRASRLAQAALAKLAALEEPA